MVDIIDHALAVTDIYQGFEHFDDVFAVEDTDTLGGITAEAPVELHAAHRRQVVAVRREEQVLEQVLRRLLGRRLARAHHPVNFYQCFQFVARGISAQGV